MFGKKDNIENESPIYTVSISLTIKAETKEEAVKCFWDTVDNRFDEEGRLLINAKADKLA